MISRAEYFSKRDPQAFPLWQTATVAIAGAGGLGSNIAISLARAGIGTLIIADFDVVSLENLNRQQFSLAQVGMPKVQALAANIRSFNPFIKLQIHELRIIPENIAELFGSAQLMLEALDEAEQKQMLIQGWMELYPQRHIVGASGLAGFGQGEQIEIRHYDSLHLVGDFCSELHRGISPIAPRVAAIANLQANLALELLAKGAK